MAGPHRQRRRTPPGELRRRRASVEDVNLVLDAAARFLEARSRSIAEVRRRLTSAGYRGSLVEAAVEDLTRQGYLDDTSFARAWVASRDRARPRGERALRAELHAKGVDRSVIEQTLAQRGAVSESETGTSGEADVVKPDERAAHRLIEKHARSLARELDPRRRRQKAYALLARNGFDPDVCRRVAASLIDVVPAGSLDDASPTDDTEP